MHSVDGNFIAVAGRCIAGFERFDKISGENAVAGCAVAGGTFSLLGKLDGG